MTVTSAKMKYNNGKTLRCLVSLATVTINHCIGAKKALTARIMKII